MQVNTCLGAKALKQRVDNKINILQYNMTFRLDKELK